MMPEPYQALVKLQEVVDDPSLRGDDRRFAVMTWTARVMDTLEDYLASPIGRYDGVVVRDVCLARIGKAQAACGLQASED